MSRAVFLSILRLYIINQTWCSGAGTSVVDSITKQLCTKIETALDEIIKDDHLNLHERQEFPTGLTLVKQELARIAFYFLNDSLSSNSFTSMDTSQIMPFLSTADYEVRLVTLEFLETLFIKIEDCPKIGENIDEIVKELKTQLCTSKMKGECLSMVS